MVSGIARWVLDETDLSRRSGARSWVKAWAPPVPGIAEVFHARIVEWAYPRHCHDTWAVLLVDEGAIRYDLEGRRHHAVPSSVTIIPPGAVHDGRPAPGSVGFRKRELYLDATFLPQSLVGPAVDRTNLVDPGLASLLAGVHRSLTARELPLDTESRLALVGRRLLDQLDAHNSTTATTEVPEVKVAHRLRDLLDAQLTDPSTLAAAAHRLHCSAGHLVRSFTREFGVSPHAYVIGRRIDIARGRLLHGDRPGDVALDLGFYDQAHFTRHFRRHTSTTPARFAAGGGR